jgi:hypothetical protein
MLTTHQSLSLPSEIVPNTSNRCITRFVFDNNPITHQPNIYFEATSVDHHDRIYGRSLNCCPCSNCSRRSRSTSCPHHHHCILLRPSHTFTTQESCKRDGKEEPNHERGRRRKERAYCVDYGSQQSIQSEFQEHSKHAKHSKHSRQPSNLAGVPVCTPHADVASSPYAAATTTISHRARI